MLLAKEPLGNFKAIAVKAENGRREALLSETGGTVQEAFQLLLNRSCEAVQHHITTHGFDFVPEKDDEDDDISDSEFSVHVREDSADESLSDNETVSIASTARVPNLSRSSRKRPSGGKQAGKNKANTRRPRSRSRSPTSTSRSSSAASDRAANPPPAQPPANFSPIPHPGYGMQVRPPHVHPNPWRNEPTPNPSRPPFVLASRPPAPYVSPFYGSGAARPSVFSTKPSPPAATSQTAPKHDIRMLVRLHGLANGEQRVLESVPLTVRSISEAAKSYARRNRGKFFNLNPAWQLRAVVRRVKMGDVDYDVSGYAGDDLRPLVESVAKPGVMPEVEVEIHTSEVVSPPPPVPPPSGPSSGPGSRGFYGEGFVMPGVEFRG